MILNSIVPWYGAKRVLATDIIRQLGRHSAYWEPFCGSMAVLLRKAPSSHETVNDKHGDLVNLIRTLQHPVSGPKLHRWLRRAIVAEDLYREWRDAVATPFTAIDDPDEACARRAYAYFLASWVGINGVSGTVRRDYNLAIRWTPGGGHGGVRLDSSVRSIPSWRRRIRRVTVLNRDAFDLIPRIDDRPGVAIYCDPPYILDSRARGGGTRYEHEFTTSPGGLFGEADDHDRLADQLRRFRRARVVVSYYDHERLADLYRGWSRIDCTQTKALANQGTARAEGRVDAPEVLLVNGPEYRDAQ